MIISLDCEATGLDVYHSARPFMVTVCYEDGTNDLWPWPVDPLTREVTPVEKDVKEIASLIRDAEILILQNPKFDYAALRASDPRLVKHWDWDKVRDTLMAAHLLDSSPQPGHGLDKLAVRYLDTDITPFEDAVEEVVKTARRRAKTYCPDWMVAKEGLDGMPSAKEKTWKADMWLPATIAPVLRGIKALDDEDYSTWDTVTEDYANTDSWVTLHVWREQEKEIRRRGLWDIYMTRLKLLPVASSMESRGVTLNKGVLYIARNRMRDESEELGSVCTQIAKSTGYDLELPKAGVNGSLREYVFDHRKWFDNYSEGGGKQMRTEKGAPAMDKGALEHYRLVIRAQSKDGVFLDSLLQKRERDTAVAYMDAYERFWLPLDGEDGWYVLHPSLNPTGTATLRWSSSNPNSQNISKKKGFSTRVIIGPAPGRELYKFDAKNIELRIPAYEAGEKDMIALFERPDDPPYYGSNHLLNFHTVYPDLWGAAEKEVGPDKAGKHCKEKYASSWYQWCKNGNFAVLYGAVDPPGGGGTADLAYHRRGCHALIRKRFSRLEAHNQRCVRFAEKHGYVETIPDKTVDPSRGYPVMCTKTARNKILATVPLNYRTQSTAMWWMGKAMIRVHAFLESLNRGEKYLGKKWPGGYFITLQVHDELVIDCPSGVGRGEHQYTYNLPIMREVKRLMELGGDDISVPTPVGCEFCPVNWAEGIDVEESL